MDLIPWNPFGESLSPRQVFERLLEDPWRLAGSGGAAGGPAVEVLERGEDIVVRAEIAGVDPEDLDVRLTEDSVTIRGQRRAGDGETQEGYYHSERQYGAFVRTIGLPATVDAARAEARFRHGLLEIVAPRRSDDHRRGRRLNVNVQ